MTIQPGSAPFEAQRTNPLRQLIQNGQLSSFDSSRQRRVLIARVVEPVSRGLSSWSGVVDNGRTIVQAAPRYINERVIQPAIRTATESIVRPAVQAISQRIVQPVQNALSRAASAIKSIFGG